MPSANALTALILVAVAAEPVGPRRPIGIARRDRQPTTVISATTTTSPAASQPTGRPNLLVADGSFELGPPDWCRLSGTSDDLNMPLTLDRAQVRHGRASARWLVEPEPMACGIRIPLPVADDRRGQSYCVSLELRASSAQDLTAAVSAGSRVESARWHVGPRWRRFDLVFTPPPGRRNASAELVLTANSPREPWVLWIDSLKVEAGSSSTAYRSSDVPLIGVSFNRRSRLFFEDQPVHITAGVQCPRGQLGGARLRWTLSGGRETGRHGSVPLTDTITSDAVIHRGPLPRGGYRLGLELLDASGQALARRSDRFGVVRGLSALARRGFRLTVPSRGPRSDALARRLGLAVAGAATASVPSDQTITSLPATRPVARSRASSLPSLTGAVGAPSRIRDLTFARAGGARTVHWPAAWNELLDIHGRWGSVAVAVNIWSDLLAGTTHLRRVRLNDGAVIIDVFSGPARHIAVLSLVRNRASAASRHASPAALEVPLPPRHITAMDVDGRGLAMAGGDNRFVVELSADVIYLVAASSLTRGRFTLQLEDARIVAPTSTSQPR